MPGEFYQKGKAEKIDIKGILDRLDHADHGLTALKALIDAVEGKLDDGTTGLAALKGLLNTLETKSDAIATQTDKLAGAAPVSGAVADAWFAEKELVTLGADNVKNKVHLLVVGIQNLVGNVNIRMYMRVNGVERMIFPPKPTTWNVATDSPGVCVINGTIGIHEAVRVTVQSDNAADNGASVDYDYMLEEM